MNRQTHFLAGRKRFTVLITLTACLALAAFAAACSTNAPPDASAARQSSSSSLAPAAAATPPTNAPLQNASQTPSPAASPDASPGNVENPLPAPTGFVNDFAKVLDDEGRRRLEEKLLLLNRRGKVDFAVVTVATTGGRSVDDYSLAVARGWGVGSKETGDGLLLLLAVEDRKWRVQVSRSLEPFLPDADVGEICRSATPLYREKRYAEGINKCVDGLTARLVEKKRIKLDE